MSGAKLVKKVAIIYHNPQSFDHQKRMRNALPKFVDFGKRV